MFLGISMPWLKPRIPVGRTQSFSDEQRYNPPIESDQNNPWKSWRLYVFMLANGALGHNDPLDAATSVDSVAVQWLKDLDSSYLNCERSLNRSFVQY